MWAAVILQAWRDLFETPTCLDGAKERQEAREEALRFLTDATGEWAESRDAICGLLGEDGDRLRDRALRQMALTPPLSMAAKGQRTAITFKRVKINRPGKLCRAMAAE